MSLEKTTQPNAVPQNSRTTIYISSVVFSLLVILGIRDISVGRVEDGLINMIIGVGLGSSFLPIDYPKAPVWQKALLILVGIFVLAATAYLLYTAVLK